MPSRLRPTASFAADAILVGDPGRALLLAQELLEEPKMSNHARGLWGYTGRTPDGEELTLQSTGMGGPSPALVHPDPAELGVRHAVRVGSAAGTGGGAAGGGLVLVERAVATAGSAASFGLDAGEEVEPDPGLTEALREALGAGATPGAVASFDSTPPAGESPGAAIATDMQTVAVLARARALGVAAATVLVVVEDERPGTISEDAREEAERRAGRAAARVLAGGP
jgi:purine-nucleoside phosphorylase